MSMSEEDESYMGTFEVGCLFMFIFLNHITKFGRKDLEKKAHIFQVLIIALWFWLQYDP